MQSQAEFGAKKNILLFSSSSSSFGTEFAVNTRVKCTNSLNSSAEKCIDTVFTPKLWYRVGTYILKSQTIPSPGLRMRFLLRKYTQRGTIHHRTQDEFYLF